MKQSIFLICICFFSYALLSCTDETITKSTDSEPFVITKAVPKEHISYSVNQEGALCFETGNDFLLLTKYLSTLSSKEFKDWEKSNNFKSYRTITDDIISTLYSEGENPAYNELVAQYASFVYLNEDGNLCPIISGQVYRSITNKEGLFYVQGVKNKFTGSTLNFYDTENKLLMNMRPLTKINEEQNLVVQYPTKTYSADGKNGVETSAKIYYVMTSNGLGYYAQLYLEITVSGLYRKSASVKWGRKKTQCHIDDITILIPGFNTDSTYPGTHSSAGDYVSLTASFGIPSQLQFPTPQPPYQQPLCLHYRARTRETGNMGMAYNLFHGVFFNVSDVTPSNPGCDKHTLITYNK